MTMPLTAALVHLAASNGWLDTENSNMTTPTSSPVDFVELSGAIVGTGDHGLDVLGYVPTLKEPREHTHPMRVGKGDRNSTKGRHKARVAHMGGKR